MLYRQSGKRGQLQYYDFDFDDEEFHESSLKNIEKAMKKIIGQKQEFVYSETDADGAVKILSDLGEGDYKIENVRNLSERDRTM